MVNESLPPVVALLGPTAVGKSALALELAHEFGGVILSADSRQVYRYMDVGTAKPHKLEQARVRHYMIDLVAPDEPYSGQRFAREATAIVRRLAAEGRPVFVVGGTGFYVRILLDRPRLPEVPPDQRLREQLRTESPDSLHARLAEADPTSAARIHPRNASRVIRALEIVHHLGGPVPPLTEPDSIPALYLGLRRERAALQSIADRRVLQQVQNGLVEETELLLLMGYESSLPTLQGFAYRQMVDYLEGRTKLADAVEKYQIATHQYIRRQMTWFRSDPRIEWVDVDAATLSRLRERIAIWLDSAGAGATHDDLALE